MRPICRALHGFNRMLQNSRLLSWQSLILPSNAPGTSIRHMKHSMRGLAIVLEGSSSHQTCSICKAMVAAPMRIIILIVQPIVLIMLWYHWMLWLHRDGLQLDGPPLRGPCPLSLARQLRGCRHPWQTRLRSTTGREPTAVLATASLCPSPREACRPPVPVTASWSMCPPPPAMTSSSGRPARRGPCWRPLLPQTPLSCPRGLLSPTEMQRIGLAVTDAPCSDDNYCKLSWRHEILRGKNTQLA